MTESEASVLERRRIYLARSSLRGHERISWYRWSLLIPRGSCRDLDVQCLQRWRFEPARRFEVISNIFRRCCGTLTIAVWQISIVSTSLPDSFREDHLFCGHDRKPTFSGGTQRCKPVFHVLWLSRLKRKDLREGYQRVVGEVISLR